MREIVLDQLRWICDQINEVLEISNIVVDYEGQIQYRDDYLIELTDAEYYNLEDLSFDANNTIIQYNIDYYQVFKKYHDRYTNEPPEVRRSYVMMDAGEELDRVTTHYKKKLDMLKERYRTLSRDLDLNLPEQMNI